MEVCREVAGGLAVFDNPPLHCVLLLFLFAAVCKGRTYETIHSIINWDLHGLLADELDRGRGGILG